MSLINVNEAKKKAEFALGASQSANRSGFVANPYSSTCMPSVFCLYNQYFNPYFNPNLNYFNNFYTSTPIFNFNPFNFNISFKPLFDFNSILSFSPSKKNSKATLSLSEVGYSSYKGEMLASAVKRRIKGFNGDCAYNVRLALGACGLGTGARGNGYQYADILSQNKNFKEISTDGLDLSSLPAGCVLVYGRGTAGYSKKYGHVEITLGNGQAASDGLTKNIREGARVFVPV